MVKGLAPRYGAPMRSSAPFSRDSGPRARRRAGVGRLPPDRAAGDVDDVLEPRRTVQSRPGPIGEMVGPEVGERPRPAQQDREALDPVAGPDEHVHRRPGRARCRHRRYGADRGEEVRHDGRLEGLVADGHQDQLRPELAV